MIHNVSWASYCYAIVFLLSFYYVAAALYYYKREIGQVLAGKKSFFPVNKGFPGRKFKVDSEREISNPVLNNETDLPPQVQSLIDEIGAFLTQAAKSGYVKAKLILSLQLLLGKFVAIKDTQYVQTVNIAIKEGLEERCSICLSDDELDLLWKS